MAKESKKNRLDERLGSISANVLLLVAQIDELKGQWIAGARLSPQALGRLKRSVLVTSTGASTRIEGAKLSDEDIEKLMQGIKINKTADRDQQEVRGYFELLNRVFDSWRRLPLSESTTKHLHKELLKYVSKDEGHRGEYKKGENKVEMLNAAGQVVGVVFDPTPAYLTPKQMQELVAWTEQALAEKKFHPLLIVGNFIVEFLKIHPFMDGNGRLSRVLTNLMLLRAGYQYMPYVSHEKLIEDNKTDYYLALRRSQKTFGADHETVLPWLEFFLSVLLEQAKMAIALLSSENVEKLLSPKQLLVWEYLQQHAEVAPGELARATAIARPTINQALDKLLRLRKIERIGEGRSTRYKKL